MEPAMKEIINNIIYYRKKKKLTQKDLAKMLNVSNTTVSGWETGTNAISINMVNKIYQLLEIPVNSIFGWCIIQSSRNEFAIWNLFNYYGKGKYQIRVKIFIYGITTEIPILCIKTTDNTTEDKDEILKTEISLTDYENAPKDQYGFATIFSDVLEVDEILGTHIIEGKILVYNSYHMTEKFKIIFDEIAWINSETKQVISSWNAKDIANWEFKNLDGMLVQSNTMSTAYFSQIDIHSDSEDPYFSSTEKSVIYAYRKHPEMQKAINKLLNIDN